MFQINIKFNGTQYSTDSVKKFVINLTTTSLAILRPCHIFSILIHQYMFLALITKWQVQFLAYSFFLLTSPQDACLVVKV